MPLASHRSRRLLGALAWALLLPSTFSGRTSACLHMSDVGGVHGARVASAGVEVHAKAHHERDADAVPAHDSHGGDFAPCPLSSTCSGVLLSDVTPAAVGSLVALDQVTPTPGSAALRSVVRAPEPPPPRGVGRA